MGSLKGPYTIEPYYRSLIDPLRNLIIVEVILGATAARKQAILQRTEEGAGERKGRRGVLPAFSPAFGF